MSFTAGPDKNLLALTVLQSTTFSGGGIVDLPFALGCSDTILPNGGGVESTCLIGNTEIRAKLTAPIDISPYEPWPAWQPFIYPPGCTARSEYPIWEVHSLEYEQPTSTASQSGSGNQTLRLNITNVSNWGNVACTVSLNEAALRASRHAELWLPCGESTPTTRPAGAAGSTKGALWGTEVLFDRDYALLGVKQHWYCDDAGEAYDGSRQPDARAGIGYLVAMAGIQGGGSVGAGGLPVSPPVLSCTNGEIGGDGGYAGQQRVEGSGSTAPAGYTCTLPGTPVNFTGYPSDDAPPRVPRTSYVHSCTINSLEVKNVTLLSYKTGDKGSFLLRNPGPADDYRIGEIKVLDDGAWHVCGGADVTPWQLVDCEYMVGGGKVGFRLGWSCDDRDPYHA